MIRPAVISFDVGGVLDSAATPMFLKLTESLVNAGHRIIVVTAIGHGLPEKWGFSESARFGTSYARLLLKGYSQGTHFHDLYVTPDVEGHPKTTGRYKNFVLGEQGAIIHVDDNPKVAEGITYCKVALWTNDPIAQNAIKEGLENGLFHGM